MKTFFAGAALASVSVALTSTDFKFMQYLAEHNKNYPTLAEYNQRLAHFTAIDEMIEEHNSSSNASFKLGHNIFSDMTSVEKKQRLGFKAGAEDHPREETHHSTDDLPASIDWRQEGAVNAVKDQGQCGSCWAFSAIGTLEGAHFLATGNLLSFAEQQLVDCNRSWTGNHGCNGGWYYTAWSYLQSSYAMLEDVYTYTAKDGTCEYKELGHTTVETLKTTFPTKNNSDQIKAALAKQPISVAIQADKAVFQQYSSGVFDSAQCGTQLDHAVMLVGYGSENGQDYFILRNSWGTTWGEQGYMKLAYTAGATDKGTCGVNQMPAYTTAL